MSHSHSDWDPHSDTAQGWPSVCVKCGIGPRGWDCALLNASCEYFDPDGFDTALWHEQANPGHIEKIIAGEITYGSPEEHERLVERLQKYRSSASTARSENGN